MPSLQRRVQFWRTLATLEAAGVPRGQALKHAPAGAFQRHARAMAEFISRRGTGLAAAMRTCPRLFSRFEVSLVELGERTGRADTAFTSLADWHGLRLQLRRRVVSGLLYPAFVYHAAAVLLPAVSMLTGRATRGSATRQALTMLGLPYAVALALYVLRAWVLPPDWQAPAALGRVVLTLPLAGTATRKLNCARFFFGLGHSLRAGLGMADAVALAAGSCSNSCLRAQFSAAAACVAERGTPLAEALGETVPSLRRDPVAAELLATAGLAGATDATALRVADTYREEAETLLQRVATLAPVAMYLVLALYIAVQIVRFYAGLYGDIDALL